MSFRAWSCAVFILFSVFNSERALAEAGKSEIRAARAEIEAMPWDSAMIEAIERAKTFAIPRRQNQGYTSKCGFYATSHVLSHFDPSAPTGHDLFELATERGWYWAEDGSSLGNHLANVARALGYRAKTGWGLAGASLTDLKGLMRKGYGVVVAIRDISDDGFPLYESFFKIGGHFVAIEGFVRLHGKEYLIVKDSRQTGREPSYVESKLRGSSLWPVSLFESAWSYHLYVAIRNS